MIVITEEQYKSLTGFNDFQFVRFYERGAYFYKVDDCYWAYLLRIHNPSAIKVSQAIATGQWQITTDRSMTSKDGTSSKVGTRSPKGYNPAREPEMTARWRCLNDRDIVVYEGIATPDSGFAPLHDFCRPDAGCTVIEYWATGSQRWQRL